MNRVLRSAVWAVMVCGAPLCARAASQSVDGLLACRDVSDPTSRLACFDRESAKLGMGSASRSAPVTVAPAGVVGGATSGSGAAAPDVSASNSGSKAAGVKASGTAPAAPAPVSSALAALTPQQQFGMSEGALAKREEAAGARPVPTTKISAHLSSLGSGSDGRMIFSLDNDQVWKQIASEGELLAKQGDSVTISRGWLNSYHLELANGRGCKVERVR